MTDEEKKPKVRGGSRRPTQNHEDILKGTARYVCDLSFHPQDYIAQSRKGLHHHHITLNWGISLPILTKWKNRHPEMFDAWIMGKAAFTVYWIDFLKDNLVMDSRTVFNQRGWEMIMQYGELNTRDRMISLIGLNKKKTIAAKNQAVLDALCEQVITLNEAEQLQRIIGQQIQLSDVAELKRKIDEIEAEYGHK